MLVVHPAPRPWLRYGLIANLVLLLALAGAVLSQAVPPTEAVRLRNSLLVESGTAADFDWTPERMPADFLVERRAPLPQFVAAMREAGAESIPGDWDKAVALAGFLSRNAHVEGPIQSDLASTYRGIVDDGRGYCADYTSVYLGLAHAAGLVAREWGFTFDGFGGHGHTLIEVFDRQRGKWVFLDVFNNVHALDAATGSPLSAMEFREFVLGRRATPVVRPNGPGRLGYRHEAKLVDYYRRGASEWYLWWGNAVLTYDAQPAVRALGHISLPAAQIAAIGAGVHPRIKVLASPENSPQLERVLALGQRLRAAFAMFAILTVLLAVQLLLFARRGPRATGSESCATLH